MSFQLARTILIVEDAPMVSDMLALRISRLFPNLEVLCTTTVGRAIELLDLFNVKVVLTDLNIADSAGLDTALRIREHTGASLIIYSDLLENKSVAAQALELGFEDLFTKGKSKVADMLERMECMLSIADVAAPIRPVQRFPA